jgi:hypothetical protein
MKSSSHGRDGEMAQKATTLLQSPLAAMVVVFVVLTASWAIAETPSPPPGDLGRPVKGGFSNEEMTAAIIFFLTFNPLCIGLIVAFGYTYTEGLKRDLHGLRADANRGHYVEKEDIQKIQKYCGYTDLVIFDAGTFWLAATAVGIVLLVCRAGFLKDEGWCAWLYGGIIMSHIVVHWVEYWRYRTTRMSATGETSLVAFVLWFVPMALDLFVMVRCVRHPDMTEVLILLLVVSVMYLVAWFALAVLYMPGTTLERIRQKWLDGGMQNDKPGPAQTDPASGIRAPTRKIAFKPRG